METQERREREREIQVVDAWSSRRDPRLTSLGLAASPPFPSLSSVRIPMIKAVYLWGHPLSVWGIWRFGVGKFWFIYPPSLPYSLLDLDIPFSSRIPLGHPIPGFGSWLHLCYVHARCISQLASIHPGCFHAPCSSPTRLGF